MIRNIALSIFVVLGTASAALAATNHHRVTAAHHPASAAALQSYNSTRVGSPNLAREPEYFRIQDYSHWGW